MADTGLRHAELHGDDLERYLFRRRVKEVVVALIITALVGCLNVAIVERTTSWWGTSVLWLAIGTLMILPGVGKKGVAATLQSLSNIYALVVLACGWPMLLGWGAHALGCAATGGGASCNGPAETGTAAQGTGPLPLWRVLAYVPYVPILIGICGPSELGHARGMPLRVFWDPPLFVYIVGRRVLGYKLASMITTRLLLGSMPLPSDVASLHESGVTHVINMCIEYGGPESAYQKAGIQQLRLRTYDQAPPTLANLQRGVRWAREVLDASPDNKIYVHCRAGVGRSACMMAAILVEYEGMTPQQAVKCVTTARLEASDGVAEAPGFRRWFAPRLAPAAAATHLQASNTT